MQLVGRRGIKTKIYFHKYSIDERLLVTGCEIIYRQMEIVLLSPIQKMNIQMVEWG
ncbi:hypothetical protein [Pantoea sp. Nvir]|uniref:hypothetical protein n=1 Tax=Pantoea sp. Nvir TaxID=2576760 RepID=UPI001359AA3A|nr:hypothetical protein [Pantoea sp. Nvir]CAJ0990694.1 tRNA/tmRNA (uracil-C(5))-methyltransferase [Pantoea sp. Nvir]